MNEGTMQRLSRGRQGGAMDGPRGVGESTLTLDLHGGQRQRDESSRQLSDGRVGVIAALEHHPFVSSQPLNAPLLFCLSNPGGWGDWLDISRRN